MPKKKKITSYSVSDQPVGVATNVTGLQPLSSFGSRISQLKYSVAIGFSCHGISAKAAVSAQTFFKVESR